MTPADDLVRISASLHYWQAHDPSVKADLYSTALQTSDGLLLIDPIPLRPQLLSELIVAGTIAGVFVTNVNHCRSAKDLAAKFAVQIFAHRATCEACEFSAAQEIANGETLPGNTYAIAIEGAAAGEMAIYDETDGGTLIIGDALINFEPYGFTFLPPKYCSNAKEMRRSLNRLLDYKFERILFAHGTPLMHAAWEKLEALLQSND